MKLTVAFGARSLSARRYTADTFHAMRVFAFAVVLIGVACRSDAQAAATLPTNWTAVALPGTESVAVRCANWARDAWSVALSADGSRLVIARDSEYRHADTVAVPGGRLTSIDHGEFGGEVWWEPDSGAKQRIANLNLYRFVPINGVVWGLAGLAHMGLNNGQLIRFQRTSAGWRAESSASLGAAPYAFLPVAGDTLLVAASGRLIAVHPPTSVKLLHVNPVWSLTYPTAITRDRAGTIYVGMRSAVARLTPSPAGFREDWLVQKSCKRRMPTDSLATCQCTA